MGLISSDERLMDFFVELMQINNVPQSSYGLKGYGEDRTCLEKVNGKWQVYYGYRGHKEDLCEYVDLIKALKDIADRCSDSEETLNNITTAIDNASNIPLYRGNSKSFKMYKAVANTGSIQVTPQYTMKKRGDCYYITAEDKPSEIQIITPRAGLVLGNATMHKRTKQGSEEIMPISVTQPPHYHKPAMQLAPATKKSKAKNARKKASEKRKKQGVF